MAEKKPKIIGVKVIKNEEDLIPILKEGVDAIPTDKEFKSLSEKREWGNRKMEKK